MEHDVPRPVALSRHTGSLTRHRRTGQRRGVLRQAPAATRWKSNLPSFLAALAVRQSATSLHVPGDVSNLPPHSADSGRGPADDFELINHRSQGLLQLWPPVHDIVSWPPKLVFGAEEFERFSMVRFRRRPCPRLRV